MRRTGVFLLLMMFCVSINAQTQQGIVKTRGRMVDGQLVPGTRLSGATVTLNFGNPLVSSNQGTFSFVVPASKSFSLVNATKQGYTLADPEYTRRFFSYSSKSPFYVVLEDENQRQADINAATRKVRKTLQTQLDKREEEIEELKAQNKLTEKEYENRLQHLYDNHSKSEQLIKEMAERYASTDYDQLDEFNQKVQQYIEDGELQKADSMIRSKGNMEQRVAEYHDAVAANRKVREELEQSENGTVKTYEDLSQDLYRQSEIFVQQSQQDSALYYLKMRADLDTTNVEAVFNYAFMCSRQRIYDEGIKYYQICLRLSGEDILDIAFYYDEIARIYDDLEDYNKAIEYYTKKWDIRKKVWGENHPDIAIGYTEIGLLYNRKGDYVRAQEFFNKALDIRKKGLDENHPKVAQSYKNIGDIFLSQGDDSLAYEYYKKALHIFRNVFDSESPYYDEMYILFDYLDTFEKAHVLCDLPDNKIASTQKEIEENLSLIAYTLFCMGKDTPAQKQGMSGTYFVLRYGDWSIQNNTSLPVKNNELRGKPKTIVVMKDGVISEHYFEDSIGAIISCEYVGKKKKITMIDAYNEWIRTTKNKD